MILVLILLITIYCIYVFKKELFTDISDKSKKDSFAVNAFNSNIVTSLTPFEQEVKKLKNIFKNTNKTIFPVDFNTFKPIIDIDMQFQKQLISVFIKYINSITKSSYDESSIFWISEIYKDETDYYMFSIDFENKQLESIITLNCFAKINENIIEKNNTEDNIQQQEIIINILAVKIVSFVTYDTVNRSILNENIDNYYRIINTLHLTEPYLTSGKDMSITDHDKLQFDEVLLTKAFEISQNAEKVEINNEKTTEDVTKSTEKTIETTEKIIESVQNVIETK
jgi:hypothetical protein